VKCGKISGRLIRVSCFGASRAGFEDGIADRLISVGEVSSGDLRRLAAKHAQPRWHQNLLLDHGDVKTVIAVADDTEPLSVRVTQSAQAGRSEVRMRTREPAMDRLTMFSSTSDWSPSTSRYSRRPPDRGRPLVRW
jgi:hypothetical protein